MESRNVKELRVVAKQCGVRGYFAMRKDDLIASISAAQTKLVAKPVVKPQAKPAERVVQQAKLQAVAPPTVHSAVRFSTQPAVQTVQAVAQPVVHPIAQPVVITQPKIQTAPQPKVTPVAQPRAQPRVVPPTVSRFGIASKAKTWSSWLTDHVQKPVKQAASTTYDWIKRNVPQSVKKIIDSGFNAFKSKLTKIFNQPFNQPEQAQKSAAPTATVARAAEPARPVSPASFTLAMSALRNATKQYTVLGIAGYDAESLLEHAKAEAIKILRENLQSKANLVLTCVMERVDIKSGVAVTAEPVFSSKAGVILESTDLGEFYDDATQKIIEAMATFQQRGSNWRFKSVVKLDINTYVYKPLSGRSYIPLPKKLAKKKAIINMQNEDNECFKWCVTRALNPIENHPERITKELKKQSIELNWDEVVFPMALNKITKFENNNANIGVNVFGYERQDIYPLRITEKQEASNVIDLLLITDSETNHYCLINSFSRLLSDQTSSREHTRIYCRRCLNGFDNDKAIAKHQTYCNEHKAVRVELPDPGTELEFGRYYRSMRVPFVVYADFESFIKPIDTCQPDPSKSFTKQYQKHTPSSFCYQIKCFDDSIYKSGPVMFTAKSDEDDIGRIFFDSLEEDINYIYHKFKDPKPMKLSPAEEAAFKSAIVCHICEKEFDENDIKVRDHCHLNGKFRGAAHQICNLLYTVPKFIPVVFHNLTGYDSHLFIKKLSGGKINCIPNNEEKYISFSREVVVDEYMKEGKQVPITRELRFIDSFRFMPSSLDALSKNLTKEQCKKIGSRYSGNQLDLLLRKGVYPYDWVDSLAKLDEPQLPPKESFYSRLSDSGISDDDYEHAQTVWKEFGCKTFRDYHDLYNVSDVLLLADVFENFRNVCMKNYRLDPAWYFTSPGLAWDAALKLTKVKLELLSDYDMILMIKHGIRGGISMISNRLGNAYNKYMDEASDQTSQEFSNTLSIKYFQHLFDVVMSRLYRILSKLGLPIKSTTQPVQPAQTVEPSYIQYLDANNLYGWAMSKALPTHGFKWMSDSELADWKSIPCILEVDLEYPKELHDLHNDYPLAPESVKLDKSSVAKLIPNLNNKQSYVVHYENLKLYESLGMVITNVHRGIRFEESAWLKNYIDLNTQLRTQATNDFEKDFFKLMNNSIFGKTMENIENRVDIRLVTSEKEAIWLGARPNYESRTIFDEKLIAVHMKKTTLFYDKPIYLGMCILDLSKTLMYDFHYNYIKNKYGDRAKLLFTDTDSLAYEIKTEDFYADIAADVESRFDTSEYPKDHPATITAGFKVGVNKKVIGMFKDEAAGKQIEEFVGLRAKLYSYKVLGETDGHKKCKGVKKNVVKKSITHDDYKDCLLTRRKHLRSMNVIRSHLHEIYTEEVNKVALSADDDKRVIREDGVHTYAHGHWRLH